MKLRVIATLILVIGAVPMATAYAAPASDAAASTAPVPNAQETSAADESSASADGDADYTKLYIESDHDHPELKPGESGEFTITVKNGEDESVEVNPHLYVSPVGEDRVKKSWVTIEGDTTIDAGEKETYTVTVEVPSDAKKGYYNGQVAFTDETVAYPGRPARPVHAASISLEVWRPPTVEIVSNTYLRGQVEAGDSMTKQIVIENSGDQAVPLSPQLKSERRYGGSSSSVDPSWVDIDAPNQIAAGETETVTVTVSTPEDADNGRYDGNLDLGLKDPARNDQNSYWQEVSLNFEVWSQPEEPMTTSFQVSEDAEDVTLTLSPRSAMYGQSSSDKQSSFDVTFVSPSGETVEANRVKVSDRGHVDLSDTDDPSVVEQGDYAVRSGGQEFVYRVDDPEAGSWDVQIMPENTIGFSYEIARNESSS
ncbi:COG1470 family protein [Halomicrococcus gelatinilyticus]|uniref:COG1470 family protein n=1 Tax=Halomicrococcus gelatinilyticus TaxID=1702103 RepID=UPI002E1305DD